MELLFLSITVTFLIVPCQSIDPDYSNFLIQNQLIYEQIFSKYQKDVAPVHTDFNDSMTARQYLNDGGEMSNLKVTFELINGSFLQLDQVSQSVRVQLEFSVEWRDARLVWNPANFSDINYIYVRRNQIWIPDFTIRNSEKTEESLPEDTQYSYISYFGVVSSFWNLVVRQPCTLKLEKFPFDTQICMFWIYSNSAGIEEIFAEHLIVKGLDVSSWSFQFGPHYCLLGEKTIFRDKSRPIRRRNSHLCSRKFLLRIDMLLFQNKGNGEWNVLNVSVRDLIAYEGDRENEMEVGEYSIVIKRTTAYYVTIILIPCFLCTLIIIVGLYMANPEELIGKLTIGLTGIMALVFLMGLAANSLPRTATVPNMTIYILTCLSLIVSSLLYVLIFPDDPFTKKIASRHKLVIEDEMRRSLWSILWRLASVHNILCVCHILAAFTYLMMLINTT